MSKLPPKFYSKCVWSQDLSPGLQEQYAISYHSTLFLVGPYIKCSFLANSNTVFNQQEKKNTKFFFSGLNHSIHMQTLDFKNDWYILKKSIIPFRLPFFAFTNIGCLHSWFMQMLSFYNLFTFEISLKCQRVLIF